MKISEQARSAEHSVKDSKSTMDSSSMSQRHLTISQVDAMMPNIPLNNHMVSVSVSADADKASSTLLKTETKSVQVQTLVCSSALKTSSTFDENSNLYNHYGPGPEKTSAKKRIEKKSKKQKSCSKRKTSVFLPRSSSSGLIKTRMLISSPSPLKIPVVDSEFQCPFCDKMFETKLMLGFHAIFECKKVRCAVCSKSFL